MAIGPGMTSGWPIAEVRASIDLVAIDARPLRGRRVGWTPLRWRSGLVQWVNDVAMGREAARRLDEARPDLVYAFTQIGEESLAWARARGVPSVVDNPNGAIRGFARVYEEEWPKWCGGTYRGHPTRPMIARVEREYALAGRVRVSSQWAKDSMVTTGVSEARVGVVNQPLDLARFTRGDASPPGAHDGPLRLVFAGAFDVRKGLLPLLRAMRAAGAPTKLVALGGTGGRAMARALAREREGLDVTVAPGDPVPAYRAADLFVLPTLEDGFGFVVAEAMACGVPVVVTDQAGAAEWVARAEAGWVVRAGDVGAIAAALDDASARRAELAAMGERGRAYVEKRAAPEACFEALREFVWGG